MGCLNLRPVMLPGCGLLGFKFLTSCCMTFTMSMSSGICTYLMRPPCTKNDSMCVFFPSWSTNRTLDIVTFMNPSTSLTDPVAQHSLRSSTVVMRPMTARRRHTMKKAPEGSEDFRNLEISWGLPPTRKHLRSELRAACSQVLAHLTRKIRSESDGTGSIIHAVVKRTISRVCSLLYGEDLSLENKLSLIEKVANRSSGLGDLRPQVLLLVCLWVSWLLLQGKSINADQTLAVVASCLPHSLKENGKSNGMILKQEGDTSRTDSSQTKNMAVSGDLTEGILQYLKLCALMQSTEWSDAFDLIKCFQGYPEKLLGQIQYLKAYCQYHLGEYSDALAACHALQDSLSTDHNMCTVYNLTGCCLKQMGKPHLALQQFRAALSASSTIDAPSLFNASLVYRDLGEVAAELESLQLLVTVLDSPSGAEDNGEWVQRNGRHPWPALVLTPDAQGSNGCRSHQMPAVDHTTALYFLAKRNLDHKRHSNAAEYYLDLLTIFENKSGLVVGGTALLPSLQTVYLEAATALLRADRLVAALAVCAKLLSKSKLLQPRDTHLIPESLLDQDEDSMESGESSRAGGDLKPRFDLAFGKRTAPSSLGIWSSRPNADGASTSSVKTYTNGGTKGTQIAHSGREGEDKLDKYQKQVATSSHSRKRQRDSDTEATSADDLPGSRTSLNGGSASIEAIAVKAQGSKSIDEALYTAHAMILQANCFHKQGESTDALEVAGQSLQVLHVCDEQDVEWNPGEKDGGASSEEESRAKRRRICSDDQVKSGSNTEPPHTPPSRISILKSSAYHMKAAILIGQSKLQDAMKGILQSLHCCQDNIDALKTHAVLLEKLGRKAEAVKAWSKLKEVKSSGRAVVCV